ncbi:glycosyltransferase family 4 protein [Vibrio cyclitrophicus]
MKVLMILNKYYPMIGGAEQQAKQLIKNLPNCDVTVLTSNHTGKLIRNEYIDDTKVIRLSCQFLGSAEFYIRLFFFMLINGKKFDVHHCHSISITSFLVSIFSRIYNKKCILKLTIAGEIAKIFEAQGVKASVKKLMIKYALDNSTVIALTKEGKNELDRFGVKDFRLIKNGVDIETLRSNVTRNKFKYDHNSGPVFGFLGRFCEQKGIDSLLKAFVSTPPNSTLVLMGSSDGQEASKVDEQIEMYKQILGKRLIVKEPQNPPYQFYGQITHFVSASKFEGMPNCVLEALSLNIPCILSNIEPHKEIMTLVKGNNIWLANDDDSLSNIMIQHCEGREEQNYSETVPVELDIKNIAQQYYQTYRD